MTKCVVSFREPKQSWITILKDIIQLLLYPYWIWHKDNMVWKKTHSSIFIITAPSYSKDVFLFLLVAVTLGIPLPALSSPASRRLPGGKEPGGVKGPPPISILCKPGPGGCRSTQLKEKNPRWTALYKCLFLKLISSVLTSTVQYLSVVTFCLHCAIR